MWDEENEGIGEILISQISRRDEQRVLSFRVTPHGFC
jgi:hypothetical protein